MILADSSAWVAFLRGTGSAAATRLRDLAGTGELACTAIVLMEVLAGARDDSHALALRRLLLENVVLAMRLPDDAESAAAIYRGGRRNGVTVRSMNDCLIAAVAIRRDVPVLHEDRDFETIARHTTLQTITA